MATVATCMHGTWKEFDLVVLEDVNGYVGRVENVEPTRLEPVKHRDLPHYVIKVRWSRAGTREELAERRYEAPPGRPTDADGVSHEVCQDLRRFAWD